MCPESGDIDSRLQVWVPRDRPEFDPYQDSWDGTTGDVPKCVPQPQLFRGEAVREFWDDRTMTDYLKDPDFMNPACVAVWEELLDELERSDVSPAEAGARDAALEEVPLKTSDHPADARESSSGT